MKVAVFLPVKGTSKRIANKNTQLLDGVPLFLVTLEKLVSCDYWDEVWLDSESQEIHSLASEYDCCHLLRDNALADNRTDGNKLFMNEVQHTDADLIVQILCTSPFISIETIVDTIEVMKNNLEYDSAVLIRKEKCYLWGDYGPQYDCNHIPNSIDLPDTIRETMGLYIVRRDAALRVNRRIGDRPFIIEASPLEAVDVNFPEDFELAELIAAGKREKRRKQYGLLQYHLSSPLLSDILDDLGVKDSILMGFSPNIKSIKVLGHASTLHLRPLNEGESFTGIYDAIKSYDYVIPGDFIVVQNDLFNYAYFGELNANMAIQVGAVGAIIDGMTRDSAATARMRFPVYSKGVSCTDVRKRATMASHGKQVTLSNVKIKQGDLIFADAEGIVVIPKKIETIVLEKVIGAIGREREIISSLLKGTKRSDLYATFGGF
jgi:regulator of RNase E activity RraA/CMP-N-acetylneuraminic acid synthetase